jgi:hypothetical protein
VDGWHLWLVEGDQHFKETKSLSEAIEIPF